MAPLKHNSNNEKRVSAVYSAAASTSAQAKATKRSKTHQDSSDASEVPDAKRRKQNVDHHVVQSATPTAIQQNKRGVKRRVIDEDELPSPPTKNKMRKTTETQSVAVVNPNENVASASRAGDNDTI